MAIRTEQTTPDDPPRQLKFEAVQPLTALPADFGQLLLPAEQQHPPAKRLVVLVPNGLTDDAELVRRIWTVAQARGLAVLYMGQVDQPQAESTWRRRLVLLAAQTRDFDGVKAEFSLSVGASWLTRLRSLQQPGDLVVCHAEQRVRAGWSLRSLGPALAGALAAPVYVLHGFCEPEIDERAWASRRFISWAGALVIVAAFFWLQINVQRVAGDWALTLLLVLSVIAEFGLLAAWNRWLQ